MHRFSAEYLRLTREGMWEDSRAALSSLELEGRQRVLDVGCGTGELTRVLAEESGGAVVGLDADPSLLDVGDDRRPAVAGDARRLPFPADAFDLVVCQALLVNLPDPAAALAEFARVSADLVAAVEPDNSAVSIESTVAPEAALASRARAAFHDGVASDPTLGGAPTAALFEEAGLRAVGTTGYEHELNVEPPYDGDELAVARRKATASGLAASRETLLAGSLDEADYADLREDWRAMGRAVVDQMREGAYRRCEVVPFYVTIGRV